MSDTILKLDNISVNYGEFPAVRNVSMDIKEGSMNAVIGLNGAGKTSLMNAISGITPMQEGRVYIGDRDVTGLSPYKLVSEGMCLVPQGGHVFNRMSVMDNLIVGSYTRRARKNKNEMLDKVFDIFPVLKEKSGEPAGSLSGGQRQMVAIGRALMGAPRIMLFDELSLGLAPVVVRDIYAAIKRINEQESNTIVLIEQDTRRAMSMTDYSYIMLKGEIVLEGPSSELGEQEVKRAYFGI